MYIYRCICTTHVHVQYKYMYLIKVKSLIPVLQVLDMVLRTGIAYIVIRVTVYKQPMEVPRHLTCICVYHSSALSCKTL